MNDIKTLIQSSIISLVIVILGLFMLCVGRSPQVNVDGPLVEAGGFESKSDKLSDEEFLNLLESANDDIFTDSDAQSNFGNDSDSKSGSDSADADILSEDDDLADLLKLLEKEEEKPAVSQKQTESSEDDAMLDQLFLAEAEQSGASEFGDAGSSDNTSEYNELEALLTDLDANEPVVTDTEDVSEKSDEEVSSKKPEHKQIEKEIDRLEQILFSKSTKIDSIQKEIHQYDEKIAQLETGGSNSLSSHIKYTSYGQNENSKNKNVAGEDKSVNRTENSSTADFGEGSIFQEEYDSALNYFYDRQYETAIDIFERLLQENSSHSLADNCQYWLGECQYGRGNFFQAIVEFEKVFTFDSADKQDDAQIMMGLAYMKLGEVNMAMEDFTWLITCYTGSEYSSTARRYMSQL